MRDMTRMRADENCDYCYQSRVQLPKADSPVCICGPDLYCYDPMCRYVKPSAKRGGKKDGES